jgi:multidrug efflux pump subunit AcrB
MLLNTGIVVVENVYRLMDGRNEQKEAAKGLAEVLSYYYFYSYHSLTLLSL